MVVAVLSSPWACAGDDEAVTKIGDVTYASGGTGEESRERMAAIARDFNLKLVFALESGAYLSAVQVAIADASGNALLQTTTNGPIFLAKLPAGAYRVVATLGEKRLERKLAVAYDKQTVFYFRWATEP